MAHYLAIVFSFSWHHKCGSIITPHGTSVDQSYRHMAPQVLIDLIAEPHNLLPVAPKIMVAFHSSLSISSWHQEYQQFSLL